MTPDEYAAHDALGLAALIARNEVSPQEVAAAAMSAIALVNSAVGAVVETYADRIEDFDASRLGSGPFRGVPFLIKDTFGHEAGRKVECGSRLCEDMIACQDTHLAALFRASGLNIIGRSAAPEFSLSATTESALYGNTCTPWKAGHSAGGSTGGGMAAVVSGMVPMAHGSDIGGSIRIPASLCGGVGLKPSRGRVTFGPLQDEGGWGLAQNFVQTKSVRDTAAMLDCLSIPQPGDPFRLPKPDKSYSALMSDPTKPLRIGWSTRSFTSAETDIEIAAAVHRVASTLEAMGHCVSEEKPDFDGIAVLQTLMDVWYFGFDQRLEGYARRTGRAISTHTLEPVTLLIYEHARRLKPAQFVAALGELNTVRRRLGQYFTRYDVWLSPTTLRVSEPWGRYHLGRADVALEDVPQEIYGALCQFALPHNIMGTPAISLPLAIHSSGLPIGIQLGARPAEEHVLLQLAAAFEETMPWANRLPPLHVTRVHHP